MLKKAQVIMLPTNDKSSQLDINDLTINTLSLELKQYVCKHPQHLYIISDDEIKKGDWKYDFKLNIIIKHGNYSDGCKKVIATTDTSLIILGKFGTNPGNVGYPQYNLPQPSQQFIEKYIEEYNKGNIITDVLLEYEKQCDCIALADCYNSDLLICDKKWKLKINPKDNTITIKKLKDSWNREEIIKILNEYRHYAWKNSMTMKDLNTWIKQNL